jgi:hypothetical protein
VRLSDSELNMHSDDDGEDENGESDRGQSAQE